MKTMIAFIIYIMLICLMMAVTAKFGESLAESFQADIAEHSTRLEQ